MLLLGLLNFTNFAFASILFKIWILYLAETNNYWWYCFLLWILPSLNLFQRCMACYFILNQEYNIFRGFGSFFVHFSRFTQQVSICSFFQDNMAECFDSCVCYKCHHNLLSDLMQLVKHHKMQHTEDDVANLNLLGRHSE